MADSENFDFYLGNFEAMLQDISIGGDIAEIRKTSYSHAIARIEQFQNSTFDLGERKRFVEKLLELLSQCRFSLNDVAENRSEHFDFLDSLTKSILSKFADVKLDSDRKTLSTEEKIIILEYLGVLDFLYKEGLNQKQLSEIFELLLERNQDNLKKAIRYVGGKVMKKGSVRNENSLLGVKSAVTKLNNDFLIGKVEIDLKSLE